MAHRFSRTAPRHAAMLLLGLALGLFAGTGSAQTEPEFKVQTLSFHCEENFTRKGKGVCREVAEVRLSGLPAVARYADITCEATWRYWSQGRQGSAFREVKSDIVAMPLSGGHGKALVEMEADLGSIVAETTEVKWASGSCSYRWRSR